MTKIELFDRLNPKRDLPQATCDVIRRVYEVMSKETEELKDDIEARKFAMAMSGKVEKQLRNQIEKMKCCGNCKNYGSETKKASDDMRCCRHEGNFMCDFWEVSK